MDKMQVHRMITPGGGLVVQNVQVKMKKKKERKDLEKSETLTIDKLLKMSSSCKRIGIGNRFEIDVLN